mgnify:CR=1 FL=1
MDMYLHWHHGNIRLGAAGYVFRKYFFPNMVGRSAPKESIIEAEIIMHQSLKKIVKIWLPENSPTKFMFGDKPSIADLSLAAELA